MWLNAHVIGKNGVKLLQWQRQNKAAARYKHMETKGKGNLGWTNGQTRCQKDTQGGEVYIVDNNEQSASKPAVKTCKTLDKMWFPELLSSMTVISRVRPTLRALLSQTSSSCSQVSSCDSTVEKLLICHGVSISCPVRLFLNVLKGCINTMIVYVSVLVNPEGLNVLIFDSAY